MFSIIQAAGWPIWPLLLASVISVALIIERLVALRRVKVVPSGLLQRAGGEFKRGANNDGMLQDLGVGPITTWPPLAASSSVFWLCITPLGLPVVPDENTIAAI